MRALLLLLPFLLAADWPRLFGPKGDSRSEEKGLIASFPAKGPEVAWKRDVGEGYAGVVVAEGKAVL
ncbi:MAG: alcohol dehydrogenase, partial [Gemmataceae bacterium]|nr:alcohol dehydrogenase [Gemmataceae bacterium]